MCPFNQFFPDLFGTTFGVMHPSQNSDWNSFSLQLCKSIASICQCCVPRVQYQCVALRLRQHLSCDQAYYSLSVRLCHYLGIWGMAAGESDVYPCKWIQTFQIQRKNMLFDIFARFLKSYAKTDFKIEIYAKNYVYRQIFSLVRPNLIKNP